MKAFTLAAAIAALAVSFPASARILVQNKYYPKQGKAELVLKTRLEASAVRAKLGLPKGVVLLRQNEVDGQPLVIWECEYATIAERDKDVARLDKAPEFTAVQARMTALLDRFERQVWESKN